MEITKNIKVLVPLVLEYRRLLRVEKSIGSTAAFRYNLKKISKHRGIPVQFSEGTEVSLHFRYKIVLVPPIATPILFKSTGTEYREFVCNLADAGCY